jgi:hypothetical protein
MDEDIEELKRDPQLCKLCIVIISLIICLKIFKPINKQEIEIWILKILSYLDS